VDDRDGRVDFLDQAQVLTRGKERPCLREETLRVERARCGQGGDALHSVLADRKQRSSGTRGIMPVGNEAWTQFAKELSADLVHVTSDRERCGTRSNGA
jgi:hypothetical protein